LAGEGIKVVAISTVGGGLYNPSRLDVDRLERLAEEAGSRAVEVYRGPNGLTLRNSLNYRWTFYVPLNLGEEIF
jgi:glutamate dehydrogenase/leucine dehydrogenase